MDGILVFDRDAIAKKIMQKTSQSHHVLQSTALFRSYVVNVDVRVTDDCKNI